MLLSAALPPRANVYSQSNARGIRASRPPGQHILSRDSFPSFRRHQSPFKNNCARRWTQKLPRGRDLYHRAQILTTQFSSSLKSINHDSTNELALNFSALWRKGCVGPVINSSGDTRNLYTHFRKRLTHSVNKKIKLLKLFGYQLDQPNINIFYLAN